MQQRTDYLQTIEGLSVLTHSENAQKATRVNQNPLNKDSTEQNVIVLNNASYSYGEYSKAKHAKIVLTNLFLRSNLTS